MWVERFGMIDTCMFYVFCVAAFIIALVAVIAMLAGCCLRDLSPGHSVSVFIHLSTLVIAGSVLVRGVNTAWASDVVFSRLCQVDIVLTLIGYSLYCSCLLAKLTTTITTYRHKSHVKVVRGRVECQARVVMTVGVLLAIILATVWESVFTPDVHLASDSGNSTVWYSLNTTVYKCEGLADSAQSARHQYILRLTACSYLALILLCSVIAMLAFCCVEIQQIYRTNIITYICVVLNSCVSVAAALLVWFLYEAPPLPAPTIMYGVIGGLELWVVFFANVLLLIGKAMTHRNETRAAEDSEPEAETAVLKSIRVNRDETTAAAVRPVRPAKMRRAASSQPL